MYWLIDTEKRNTRINCIGIIRKLLQDRSFLIPSIPFIIPSPLLDLLLSPFLPILPFPSGSWRPAGPRPAAGRRRPASGATGGGNGVVFSLF
uniref:Uncharacterized protein n=1 Tax=Oryza sativa subsp. japonica TaxID=39947 RepID=Q5VNF5_ORYSJ|nr:hypothetical protein [Oryza sativa Japonica Group]